jgi:hypothetical protein
VAGTHFYKFVIRKEIKEEHFSMGGGEGEVQIKIRVVNVAIQ